MSVSGCLAIGVVMVLVIDVWPSGRLMRPFLGTGLLGGYTTFSTYIVEAQRLIEQASARTALAYLAGTVVAAVGAVYVGITTARLCTDRLARRRETG
ncbi:MAG: CrcB family protein [Sporichthyaceae bacterium]|nr:CrcB family protein [Sporichthyaceae bacterium]